MLAGGLTVCMQNTPASRCAGFYRSCVTSNARLCAARQTPCERMRDHGVVPRVEPTKVRTYRGPPSAKGGRRHAKFAVCMPHMSEAQRPPRRFSRRRTSDSEAEAGSSQGRLKAGTACGGQYGRDYTRSHIGCSIEIRRAVRSLA